MTCEPCYSRWHLWNTRVTRIKCFLPGITVQSHDFVVPSAQKALGGSQGTDPRTSFWREMKRISRQRNNNDKASEPCKPEPRVRGRPRHLGHGGLSTFHTEFNTLEFPGEKQGLDSTQLGRAGSAALRHSRYLLYFVEWLLRNFPKNMARAGYSISPVGATLVFLFFLLDLKVKWYSLPPGPLNLILPYYTISKMYGCQWEYDLSFLLGRSNQHK